MSKTFRVKHMKLIVEDFMHDASEGVMMYSVDYGGPQKLAFCAPANTHDLIALAALDHLEEQGMLSMEIAQVPNEMIFEEV